MATTKDVSPATPGAAPVPVVVEGKPLEGAGAPDTERAEFMRRHDALRGFNDPANLLAARIADSNLAFYDDNVANSRYIAAIGEDATTAPTGSPLVQLQRRPFPGEDALAGTLVYREDGTSFRIPPGVRSLAEVTDPDTGKPLVGEIDPKKHKNRIEAAGLTEFVTLKPDGSVEAKESKKK
jgi:hypothetical protein